MLRNGETVTVSIDRVKPAYLLHDPHVTNTHTHIQTQQNTIPQTTKETKAEESGVRKRRALFSSTQQYADDVEEIQYILVFIIYTELKICFFMKIKFYFCYLGFVFMFINYS